MLKYKSVVAFLIWGLPLLYHKKKISPIDLKETEAEYLFDCFLEMEKLNFDFLCKALTKDIIAILYIYSLCLQGQSAEILSSAPVTDKNPFIKNPFLRIELKIPQVTIYVPSLPEIYTFLGGYVFEYKLDETGKKIFGLHEDFKSFSPKHTIFTIEKDKPLTSFVSSSFFQKIQEIIHSYFDKNLNTQKEITSEHSYTP